jgi:uncharacterized membrane protein YbhN (UPF0104 family)
VASYIAVYTASYVAGLLSLIPGGLVVREAALTIGLTALELTSPPEALVLALTSRVWITLLEILPAVVLLLIRVERHGQERQSPARPR